MVVEDAPSKSWASRFTPSSSDCNAHQRADDPFKELPLALMPGGISRHLLSNFEGLALLANRLEGAREEAKDLQILSGLSENRVAAWRAPKDHLWVRRAPERNWAHACRHRTCGGAKDARVPSKHRRTDRVYLGARPPCRLGGRAILPVLLTRDNASAPRKCGSGFIGFKLDASCGEC